MSSKQNKTSSFKFTLFKWSAIILLLGLISYPLVQILTVFFGKIDQKLRARVFMAYRTKFADAMMISGRYKFIKPNAYPSDEARDKFNKKAQDKDKGVLTKFPYPEHFAREAEWNFTLCDKVYYLLWNIRYKVCSYYKGHEQKNIDGLTVPAKDVKVDRFFRQVPEISDEDFRSFFKDVDENGKGWAAASGKFCDIVLRLIDKPEDYKFKGDTIAPALQSDIVEFLLLLGYPKETVDANLNKLADFFISYGEAYPSVIYSTIYSRLYYYFVFLTLNAKFDYSEIDKKDMKVEEFNKNAMLVLANVFAQLFSRVYEEDWKYELKEPTVRDKITRWFGPVQDVKSIKDQTKNIEIVKQTLTKKQNTFSWSQLIKNLTLTDTF